MKSKLLGKFGMKPRRSPASPIQHDTASGHLQSSSSTLGREDDNTQVSSNASDEKPNRNAHDLDHTEAQSEAQYLRQRGDPRAVSDRPSEDIPEPTSNDEQFGEDTQPPISPWRSRGGGIPNLFDSAKEAAGAFGPLNAILGAISTIYDDYEDTTSIKRKIQDLCSRVAVLEAVFRAPTNDVAEKRRRDGLLRKLKGLEEELQSFYERARSRRLADRIQADGEVSGLLEDLGEAISDYQTMQQMAIFEQGRTLMGAAEAAILNNFRCAQGAEYRHGNRKGCLKGTRTTVLDEIDFWAKDFNRPPVYWLNGLAGTGKSAIAQTTAERLFADGRLGASFFCSRDFEDRSNLDFIFPTLAVQLARRYLKFRSIFIPLVQSDPGIAHESLYNQMDKLIVEPLRMSAIPTVIVIDALDECKDEDPASAILSVLGQFVSQIPKVKFFVTGRPEPRIRQGFRLPLLAKVTDVFVLHEVESSRVDSDIRLFLKQSLLELARRRGGLDGWPTVEQLDLLCYRAAGLFAYAVATVKFVDHRNDNPKNQLDRILRLPGNSQYEGKTKFNSGTTLDSLYMSILQEAFGGDDPEDDSKVRSVLGAVVLAANPLSPSTIATLLGIDRDGVFRRLLSVHSLLILQEDRNSIVRPFHKSFPDFIVDPARCVDKRFHVSPLSHHPELLAGCLKLMNQTLKGNMCDLPDAVANSEVGDLRERTERYLDPALRYACTSWHKHPLDEHSARTPGITSAIHRFLEKKFLFWLEVLSVLGAAREAVDALEVAAKWLEASPTLDLVNDCFRFVTGFFEIISTSAPHIYHSAVPLSPRESIVRRLYEQHARPLARIVHGLPTSWEPSIAAVKFPSPIEVAVWSPCSRFIAIVWGKSRATIEILDAVTLRRRSTLESPLSGTRWFVFSPDSRLLTWFGDNPGKFMSWDLETGVLVSAIPPEQSMRPTDCRSATYSACGTMFAVLFLSGRTSAICIYNVLSGKHIYSHSVEEPILHQIWTHEESLRFATAELGSITIWEVEFDSTHAPTEAESLPIPGDSRHPVLHPDPLRLAFITGGRVKVWSSRDSKLLLDSADVEWPRRMSFSLDGRYFACGTNGPEFYLWKKSPTGYVLHQKLVSSTGPSESLLSPNGGSIIAFGGSAIQLWRTTDPSTSISVVPTRASQGGEGNFILGFSPDETLAAVTRMGGEMVTVLDLKSGASRLTIDTGMKVYALGVSGSTIAVVGEGKIVTWNLPAGNDVLNFKANVNDSFQIIAFNHPPFPIVTPRPTISMSSDLHRIAIVEARGHTVPCLHLYDVPTGQCLGSVPIKSGISPWFTPDGGEVWCVTHKDQVDRWKIVEDKQSGATRLEHLESTTHLPDGLPWQSSRGYSVTGCLWVLGSTGKRLLWLPPHWRSDEGNMIWGGQFLASLGCELPEPVILELQG